MTDGSIVFSTALDNKQLEKQLGSITKKIESIQDKIDQKRAEQAPLAQESSRLAAQLDAAKAQLEYMQSGEKFFSSFSIERQENAVRATQKEWDAIQGRVDKYDEAIRRATIELERNKQKAGAVSNQLADAGKRSDAVGKAMERAKKSMRSFSMRMREVVRSALLFTVISQGLASFRDWMGKVIRSNDEASAAVARLKGALLVLVQPLINVVIPAFTMLVNILTGVVQQIAKVMSTIFGTTIDQSKESAKALYSQTDAIKSTGAAAKKASKQLASFDEINQLSNTSSSGGGGASGGGQIAPDFSGVSGNWLKDRLGETADMLTAALLLGGIALVAIGAATGSLPAVLAGLLLLNAGVYVGEQTGTLQSWAEALGLNDVAEFVITATILAGIAMVAIGAAMANLPLIITGLLFIGTAIAYAKASGKMKKWSESLGLDAAPSYVTAALLVGGMALIVIGAVMKNILMVGAGLALLGAGVYVGKQSGTFQKWWDALMLPQVAQWVTTGLLLGGLALTVIGILMKNVFMLIGGLVMIGASIAFGITSGTFQKWWEVLMLPQVAQWVTAGLLLGGLGLLVIGIATGNLPMLLFGLGLLGTAITFGITSGTFSRWIEDIKNGLKNGWSNIKSWWNTDVAPKLTLAFWQAQFNNIKEGLISKIKDAVNGGITLFNRFIDWLNSKMRFSWDSFSILGKEIIPAGSVQLFTIPKIPMLAQGAVIPPNREFLAMLGDQKSGNNIEAPESLIRKIVREEGGGTGNRPITVVMQIDGREFGRVVYQANNTETQRVGVRLAPV